jgi:hypothetical protein
MTTTLNIEFSPIVRPVNYAPERTFVTKWDVEIENNRAKKIARTRDRDTKYFIEEDFEYQAPTTSSIVIQQVPTTSSIVIQQVQDDAGWEIESSDDGDGEETRQKWLRAVEAENAYYDRKYGKSFEWYDMNEAELDTNQAWTTHQKRPIFPSEESDFKRVRA